MPVRIVFVLFVVSGFSALLYQVVWLRLAFAAFGIVTPVLSIVLSVFMLGLALGAWAGGRLAARPGLSPAVAYALAELGVAAGAFVVPAAFDGGARTLLDAGELSSGRYLALSAPIITAAMLGFTTLMGATLPLMMAFVRAVRPADTGGFSYLYAANAVGASAGAALTALVLIETSGFRGTLLCGAVLNVLAAGGALGLTVLGRRTTSPAASRGPAAPRGVPGAVARGRLSLLFATGLLALAMEVVWTRAFTPVMSTNVYAFAALLGVYLLATWMGSALYRRHRARGRTWRPDTILGALFAAALLPLVLNDPRWHAWRAVVLVSIVPFSALLGYLTPRLIDDHASGDPRGAGRAYAVNVAGCIAGPLIAGYLLLPYVGVKWSQVLLALVCVPHALAYGSAQGDQATGRPARRALGWAGAGILLLALTYTSTYEEPWRQGPAVIRRDHAATVVSRGEGMDKQLLVNGADLTSLTTITKLMAHLPLVVRAEPPRSTLVIGLGMGTTFRSLATWPGRTTAVELVPSVRDAFGFYFDDAARVLARPGTAIVVDDGRRFLGRTRERFDMITLDPPPPVEAAGSSLLYSVEFYRLLRTRLAPGGVLQQWLPTTEPAIERAVAASVRRVFPHVKIFHSIEGWGHHFIAADTPLATPTVEEAIARMPEAAMRDLVEWRPDRDPRRTWSEMLAQERAADALAARESVVAVTDDRPFNEYFLLRRSLRRLVPEGR